MTPVTPPTSGRSRFVSNTAALAASTVISTLITLVQIKILAGFLLPGEFGSFAAMRGFSLLVAMLAANAFPQLLVRFLPFHESNRLLSRAIVLSGVCFILPLFLLTIFVFIVEFNRSFFFDFLPAGFPMGPGESGELFLWFYMTTLGVTLKLVLYAGFNGLRRLPVQVALEVSSLAAQVVWIYAWRDQLSLARLFMILGVTSLAACAIGLPWYFVRMYRDVAPERAARGGSGAGLGYRAYWVGAAGMSLVAVAFTDVDRYVLSQVLALAILSQFHIASRVLRLTNRFLSVPVLAFQPEVTRLDAERRGVSILSTTVVFFKFNAAVGTAAAFALAALSPEIIRLVSNARYDAAVPLLRILAVSIPLTAMTAPLTAVMKALDQVRRAFYCDLIWAVTYIVLLLQLGGAFGLAGVGAAQVAASLVQLAVALSLSRVRPAVGAALATAAKSVLSAVVAFAPVALASAFLPASPARVVAKVALLLLAIVVFRLMAVKWLRLFTGGERGTLGALLNRRGLSAVARWVV
jgi:O-antigen/teichoic acid export membrane protein